MRAREREHIRKVKSHVCIACGHPAPSDAHHIREGVGMSERSSHFLTVPLCKECHQGSFSIHNSRRQFTNIYGSELELLAKTIESVYR